MTIKTATLFVIERRLHDKEKGPPIGVRFDSEILPKGSYVIGFLIGEDGRIEGQIIVPSILWMLRRGDASLEAAKRFARQFLGGVCGRDEVDKELVA